MKDETYGAWIVGVVIGAMIGLLFSADTWAVILCAIIGGATGAVLSLVWKEGAPNDGVRPRQP
jgi:F0F1-type ATP synthase assembly protein I